jgi:hypothetical protein
MGAETSFENLTTITYCCESPARDLAVTIVSAQIAQRLFAFEDRR